MGQALIAGLNEWLNERAQRSCSARLVGRSPCAGQLGPDISKLGAMLAACELGSSICLPAAVNTPGQVFDFRQRPGWTRQVIDRRGVQATLSHSRSAASDAIIRTHGGLVAQSRHHTAA